MIIETKYDLGQIVWPIEKYCKYKNFECEACKSQGKIDLAGKKYTCPECIGARMISRQQPSMWHLGPAGYVGKVCPEIWDPHFLDERQQPKARVIKYMIDSTGIGSGTLWPEDRLFATQAEAQAECDRLNREEIVNQEGNVL